MRKFANSSSILALAMMLGLTVTASGQDQDPKNSNTSPSSKTQSSQSSTTSSTDTTTTPTADQNSQSGTTSQTGTSSKSTRSNRRTQSSSTDASGTTSNTTGTSADSSRNRTVDAEKSMIGEKDRRFLTDASEGGLMEVQMAQKAQQQASSQAVKDFARQLEQDHTNANKQLMDIATQRNVSLPTTPMANNHQQSMDKLNKLTGAEFDKQYIKLMIKDHKKDIKEFESEANNGMDSSLKNFASSTLPTLRNHLQMAEQIDKGGTATTTKSSADANTSTTKTTVSESTRSRDKGATVREEDKSTINKVTPSATDTSTTQVDRTTTNPDGTVKQDQTTIKKETSKP